MSIKCETVKWTFGPDAPDSERQIVLGGRLAGYVEADEAQDARLDAEVLRYMEGDDSRD